jgi:hypothetical protein
MNDAMRRFETLVGDWDLTMTHAAKLIAGEI